MKTIPLSLRIGDGLMPPAFKPAAEIAATEIDAAMESQRFLYVIEIPAKFQSDILVGGSLACKSV
jgi:ABC-2 type transport system permease protein